jgi:hypothetical protein
LDEVLCAPLIALVVLFPLIVDVKQGQMITAWPEKGLPRIIGVDLFLFRTIKYRITH